MLDCMHPCKHKIQNIPMKGTVFCSLYKSSVRVIVVTLAIGILPASAPKLDGFVKVFNVIGKGLSCKVSYKGHVIFERKVVFTHFV